MTLRNPEWKQRFAAAHKIYQDRETPNVVKDHGYLATTFPDIRTSNGLTTFIIKFLNWHGHRATRINVAGRLIEGLERQESGTVLKVKKYIKSSTRKGTADIGSTILGRSAMWEVKVGRDTPNPEQLAEQLKERRAGGIYEFVKTPEDFLYHYDLLVLTK